MYWSYNEVFFLFFRVNVFFEILLDWKVTWKNPTKNREKAEKCIEQRFATKSILFIFFFLISKKKNFRDH